MTREMMEMNARSGDTELTEAKVKNVQTATRELVESNARSGDTELTVTKVKTEQTATMS